MNYEANKATQQRSFYFHGLVGCIIGLILGLICYLCVLLLANSPLLSAAILLTCWVGLTGALHLDGLGDTADAWLGGYGDKNKTLAIMKDPTSGPAAVVCISLLLIVKFATLSSLMAIAGQQIQYVIAALIFTPVLARLTSMTLFGQTPYVREQGIASGWISNINMQSIGGQWLVVIALLVLLMGIKALLTVIMLYACYHYLRKLMLQRIGGATGDTAGALIEISEAIGLIAFVVGVSIKL